MSPFTGGSDTNPRRTPLDTSEHRVMETSVTIPLERCKGTTFETHNHLRKSIIDFT